MSPITTRRAIEVCLSRLRMDDRTRDILAHHLASEIAREEGPLTDDVDELRAAFAQISVEADVNGTYPRRFLVNRLHEVRRMAKRRLA